MAYGLGMIITTAVRILATVFKWNLPKALRPEAFVFAANRPEARGEKRTPFLDGTARWLDDYFSGGQPDFTPPLHLIGSAFRLRVWARLLEIPYGQTTTYGALLGDGASARAVGGAVGRNPISIIVPCHRVIGADGSLTGYAGGMDRKIRLLALERQETKRR